MAARLEETKFKAGVEPEGKSSHNCISEQSNYSTLIGLKLSQDLKRSIIALYLRLE